MMGRDALILGLGQSVGCYAPGTLAKFWTIGVNDISRHVNPDFLVLCDSPNRFESDRLKTIKRTEPLIVFCHPSTVQDWVIQCPQWRTVVVQMRKDEVKGFLRDEVNPWVPCGNISPIPSMAIASWMGFERVGLLGVDLLPTGRFWERGRPDGRWRKEQEVVDIQKKMEAIAVEAKDRTRYVQLSHVSRLKSGFTLDGGIPRGDLDGLRMKGVDVGVDYTAKAKEDG